MLAPEIRRAISDRLYLFWKDNEDLCLGAFWVAVVVLYIALGDSCTGGGRYGPDVW